MKKTKTKPEEEPGVAGGGTLGAERLLPGEGEVRVRLYSEGLGDCFLLAFPRPKRPDDPCYLLIDCGAAKSDPGRKARASQVVENIALATGGHLDVLVITHQHFDHVSGFQDVWQQWKKIVVDALYLPWTESTAEKGEHSSTTDFRKVLEKAAEQAEKQGALSSPPDIGAPEGPGDMDEIMTFIRSLPSSAPRYFVPGDVFRLPGADSHGYVLGPPLPTQADDKGRRYIELLVDGASGVMYSYEDLGMKVDSGRPSGPRSISVSDDQGIPALASGILSQGPLTDLATRHDDETFSPFSPELRLDWDAAMSSGFFQQTYAFPKTDWRNVNTDWMASSSALALRAGGFTNNVSFVIAFDLPGSDKMLLFPGDAQVGSWLSWHDIQNWNFRDTPSDSCNPPGAGTSQTLMENLLSRVAFYKVGHHGSHNATIKDKGLEKMTRKDLVAFVPVSIPVAQDYMSYCPMPFYPVIRAVQRATAGRVFLPNGNAIEPLPVGQTQDALRAEAGIAPASTDIPAVKNVEAMPLYLDFTLSAS